MLDIDNFVYRFHFSLFFCLYSTGIVRLWVHKYFACCSLPSLSQMGTAVFRPNRPGTQICASWCCSSVCPSVRPFVPQSAPKWNRSSVASNYRARRLPGVAINNHWQHDTFIVVVEVRCCYIQWQCIHSAVFVAVWFSSSFCILCTGWLRELITFTSSNAPSNGRG